MVSYRETHEWRDAPHGIKAEEIVVRFCIEFRDGDSRIVNSITAEIFKSSNPLATYRIQVLEFNKGMDFQHIFNPHTKVHGRLLWRSGPDVSSFQQIIGRVEIGDPGDVDYWCRDGYMIRFKAIAPQPSPYGPNPHPDSPIPVPDLADAEMILDAHLEMAELFPFVYIRPWPRLADWIVDQGFMLAPTDVEHSAFYTKLTTMTGDQKVQEAVALIDDALSTTIDSNNDSDFLPPRLPLPTPFEDFLDFPSHLRHDCSMEGLTQWVEERFESWNQLAQELAAPPAKATVIKIWNSVISLMITMGYDHNWLSRLIHLLQVAHLMNGILSLKEKAGAQAGEIIICREHLTRMIQAVLVLPEGIFPVFPPVSEASPPAIQPYAVGTVWTVHYKADRYILGDVQKIEIITQGETRQEVHRLLRQTEAADEGHSGIDANEIRCSDTTTVDLINQVEKTLSQRLSKTTVNDYQTDYGLPQTNTMKITGNWQVDDHPAGGYLKDISKFARDVVEHSVKALNQTSMQRRHRRIFDEAETTETRTLSNIGTDGDRQVVYRWVNREYKLLTKSSGDRLVFEILVDHPGRNLLKALSKHYNIEMSPPLSPAQLGVKCYQDLSPEPLSSTSTSTSTSIYYLDVFDAYGIVPDDSVPPATRIVSAGLMSRNPVCETNIEVPLGYLAQNATATVTSFSQNPKIQVIVGGIRLTAQSDSPQVFKGDFSTGATQLSNTLWASVLCASPPAAVSNTQTSSDSSPSAGGDSTAPQTSSEFETFYAFTLDIQCERSQTTLANWQVKTYQKIQSAYQEALTHYNEMLSEQRKILQVNPPRFLKDMVNDQIVQSAIALLTKTAVTRSSQTAGNTDKSNANPRFNQFLRSAFDWESMSAELLNGEDSDPPLVEKQSGLLSLFSSPAYLVDFIHAKKARLTLSVKPAYARTLLLAFRTGEIWPCEEDIAPCTPDDLNIVELLRKQHKAASPRTEDQWTVQLPTEMVALSRQDPFA